MSEKEKEVDMDSLPLQMSTLDRHDDPFAPREGKTLTWKNVNMTLAGKGDEPDRQLLSDVWGEVPDRETTAIMGPSGAGKVRTATATRYCALDCAAKNEAFLPLSIVSLSSTSTMPTNFADLSTQHSGWTRPHTRKNYHWFRRALEQLHGRSDQHGCPQAHCLCGAG